MDYWSVNKWFCQAKIPLRPTWTISDAALRHKVGGAVAEHLLCRCAVPGADLNGGGGTWEKRTKRCMCGSTLGSFTPAATVRRRKQLSSGGEAFPLSSHWQKPTQTAAAQPPRGGTRRRRGRQNAWKQSLHPACVFINEPERRDVSLSPLSFV